MSHSITDRLSLTNLTRRTWLLAVALAVSISACTPSTTPRPSITPTVSLKVAGATSSAPLYQHWFSDYHKQKPNIQINYQPIGTRSEVEQFIKGKVDFGISDVAMNDEEIAQIPQGAVFLPAIASGIVLAYNLPDVKNLRLSRQVYADIFLGKIKKWNNSAIAKLNPNTKLPDKEITVVYRTDPNGTNAAFSKHLTAISPEWKKEVGEGKTIEWPTGIRIKRSEGVTAQIQQIEGAIGYLEYSYAQQQHLFTATLENQAGNFIKPTTKSFSLALAEVKLPENLRTFAGDPKGTDSYPIVSYTWILAHKHYDSIEKAKALKDVLKWVLTEGQKITQAQEYVLLPTDVVTKVQATVNTINP